MNNFLTRTFYGFLFAVVMIGSIILGMKLLAALMLLIVLTGTHEMIRLNKKVKLRSNDRFFIYITSLFFYAIISSIALDWVDQKSFVLLIPALLFPFIHALFSKRLLLAEIATIYWSSLLFVALPASLMLLYYDEKFVGSMAGYPLLLIVIVFIWINDIFAYLVGIQFGKHRLYERISPKKSWEGSIGGLLFTLIAAWSLAHFTDLLDLNDALVIAVIVVVTGSLGDLIESMIKRQANVKDSGKILPGHGGVLDRFDAAFFAIPFVFVYLIMIN